MYCVSFLVKQDLVPREKLSMNNNISNDIAARSVFDMD